MELDVLKIKILLAEQGKTQAQLAAECSVARQNICRILSKGRCTPVTAGKIACGLGVRVADIVKAVQ